MRLRIINIKKAMSIFLLIAAVINALSQGAIRWVVALYWAGVAVYWTITAGEIK